MNKLSKDEMGRVANMIRDRYTTRLKKFGDDPRTLGWDTRENQRVRFYTAATMASFQGRSVFDIGCGLADFFAYLLECKTTTPSTYTGLDLNPELIEYCQKRFPNQKFMVHDLMCDELRQDSADVVCLFGLLNLKFSYLNNVEFAYEAIRRAFQASREVLIVDMLSIYRTEDYPEDDFVYYYSPEEMLSFSLSLTPKVQIRHDYAPIPQREFMLALRH